MSNDQKKSIRDLIDRLIRYAKYKEDFARKYILNVSCNSCNALEASAQQWRAYILRGCAMEAEEIIDKEDLDKSIKDLIGLWRRCAEYKEKMSDLYGNVGISIHKKRRFRPMCEAEMLKECAKYLEEIVNYETQ